MHDALRRLAGLALTATLLGGCANAPSFFGQRSPEQLLTQAQQQPPAQAAATRLQAADILSRQGEQGVALSTLTGIDPSLLSTRDHIHWARLTAELALAHNNAGVALKATDLVNDTKTTLSVEDRRALLQYRAQAYGVQGEALRGANLLLDAQRHDNLDPAYNDVLWQQLTALSKPQLGKLVGKDELREGWISLVQLSARTGHNANALQAGIQDWKQRYPQHPAALQLPAVLVGLLSAQQNESAPTADIQHIAVFLPESGALSPLAKALKDGINTQYNVLKASGQPAPEITYYNTSNTGLDELYAQATLHGDQIVIGPLDKELVTALESRPSVPLPTLALNYGNNARNTTQSLYEYGLSAEDEARQVAQYASAAGLHRAAILVPDNDWGTRIQEAFRQQWTMQGDTVLNTTHYAPNAPVSQALKQAVNPAPDMLFLLALPNYGRQVPPTLKYQGLGSLPVYATSHVYTGAPNAAQDNDLNGITFPDIPWYLPELVGGVEQLPFKESYTALTSNPAREGGVAVLKLNAMGVDALALSRQLSTFDSTPSTTMNGATGTLRLSDDKRFQRQLPWARFQRGLPTATTSDAPRG